jgi:hypothetical protein
MSKTYEQTLKLAKKLTTTPIVTTPNLSMEFHIHCDALNVATGVALAQNVNGNINSLM